MPAQRSASNIAPRGESEAQGNDRFITLHNLHQDGRKSDGKDFSHKHVPTQATYDKWVAILKGQDSAEDPARRHWIKQHLRLTNAGLVQFVPKSEKDKEPGIIRPLEVVGKFVYDAHVGADGKHRGRDKTISFYRDPEQGKEMIYKSPQKTVVMQWIQGCPECQASKPFGSKRKAAQADDSSTAATSTRSNKRRRQTASPPSAKASPKHSNKRASSAPVSADPLPAAPFNPAVAVSAPAPGFTPVINQPEITNIAGGSVDHAAAYHQQFGTQGVMDQGYQFPVQNNKLPVHLVEQANNTPMAHLNAYNLIDQFMANPSTPFVFGQSQQQQVDGGYIGAGNAQLGYQEAFQNPPAVYTEPDNGQYAYQSNQPAPAAPTVALGYDQEQQQAFDNNFFGMATPQAADASSTPAATAAGTVGHQPTGPEDVNLGLAMNTPQDDWLAYNNQSSEEPSLEAVNTTGEWLIDPQLYNDFNDFINFAD
ncbi:hypothetical protein B0J12DRAFT_756774 [Macrophomina phaseolina]|uniref:Uncharacterized protein n=1 Tax=Macrophomina phaseolina TaxID=35725 RepID=A0ABQ8G734_9PEZI|nr:hypothetical protein B0J12DRAFT_756774 [Macrophomina phaseolina]